MQPDSYLRAKYQAQIVAKPASVLHQHNYINILLKHFYACSCYEKRLIDNSYTFSAIKLSRAT